LFSRIGEKREVVEEMEVRKRGERGWGGEGGETHISSENSTKTFRLSLTPVEFLLEGSANIINRKKQQLINILFYATNIGC